MNGKSSTHPFQDRDGFWGMILRLCVASPQSAFSGRISGGATLPFSHAVCLWQKKYDMLKNKKKEK